MVDVVISFILASNNIYPSVFCSLEILTFLFRIGPIFEDEFWLQCLLGCQDRFIIRNYNRHRELKSGLSFQLHVFNYWLSKSIFWDYYTHLRASNLLQHFGFSRWINLDQKMTAEHNLGDHFFQHYSPITYGLNQPFSISRLDFHNFTAVLNEKSERLGYVDC